MSGASRPVCFSLLDKDYLVACEEQDRDSLYASVELLRAKVQEVRDSAKIIGNERMVVMAALNIAHEYLEYKQQKERYTLSTDACLRRLQVKIDDALSKGCSLEIQEAG